MEKEIFVRDENLPKLMQAFKVTRQMVWKALNFRSDSPLARRIRFTALKQFGGVPNWQPTMMETTFDEENGWMKQDFGNGVVIHVVRRTGEAVLSVMEEPKVITKNVTIEELMMLQDKAVRLAMSA